MSRLTVRGCELAYELIGGPGHDGTGTPFVWGHGLSSSRADEDRRPLIDLAEVAASRRVLRYDARGHGESGSLTTSVQGDWSE
ncbi:MAG: alpha/beta hydrolase, partial [Actinobacteria bacterium]